MFCIKGVLGNFAKFTGKHLLCLGPATLLKKGPCHRCFPVNFAKFLRSPFLQSTSIGCFCKKLYYRCLLGPEVFVFFSETILEQMLKKYQRVLLETRWHIYSKSLAIAVDTGRKLNVHKTSYVRSIYVLCLLECERKNWNVLFKKCKWNYF